LPREARERLVGGGAAVLDQILPWPPAVVPATPESWLESLADAAVTGGGMPFRAALADAARAAVSDDAQEVRAAADGLVRAAADFAGGLWMLSALRPASGGEVAVLRDEVLAGTRRALDAIVSGEPGEATRCGESISDAVALVQQVRAGTSDDPCQAVFGGPRSELCDDRGILSPSRILAVSHGRYGLLMREVAAVLSPVTSRPPWGIDGLHAAIPLVVTPRPVITLRAATGVRTLIEQGMEADPISTATPLRDLKLRVDRSAASHAGMVRTARNLDEATTESEQAVLKLDLYRRMVESQLRPWAWTLLRMGGRSGAAIPELTSLREQLIAEGDPLLAEAASGILAAPRNAAAHEDFLWDERNQVLVVGSAAVSIADIDDATSRAYAFMLGAECGMACARAESPALAAMMDAEDPPGGLPAIDVRNAVNRFGTNRLRLVSSTYEQRTLTVVLENLPFHGINPCFQAIARSRPNPRRRGAVQYPSTWARPLRDRAASRRGRCHRRGLVAGAEDPARDALEHVPAFQCLLAAAG
jgi:hypothetical protein